MKRSKNRALRVGVLPLAAFLLAISATTVSAADEKPAADPAISSAQATDEADGEKEEIQGSDAKGKYWFKKNCKDCHVKGAEGGEVTPLSKTMKQWERYFRKEQHTGEQPLLDVSNEEQLIHIRTFLINHAADSDQPETCG